MLNKNVRVLAINRGKNLTKTNFKGFWHKGLHKKMYEYWHKNVRVLAQKCPSTGTKMSEYWQK